MNRNAVIAITGAAAVVLAGALIVLAVRAGAPGPDEAALPPAATAEAPEAAPEATIVMPGAEPELESEYAFREEPIPPAIAILIVPVEGVTPEDLTDSWSEARAQGRAHAGIDIPAPRGTPVLAADSGAILKFFDSEDGGTTIYQSDSTGDYVFYYAHLNRRAPGLGEGDAVKAGQVIGAVGTSGNADSAAPHLHFEITIAPEDGGWTGGEPINPYDVLGR